MDIKEVKITDLKPANYNPRQMTKRQVKDLTASIKQFGLVEPIVANSFKGRENVIVGGHQRVAIATQLGFTSVPVVYVKLPMEQEKKLNLRLNKNLGEWDMDKLANFEQELLLEVGFDRLELDSIFDLGEDNFDAKKEADKITEPVTKLGDLWALGEHRLLCGDATDINAVQKLMGGGKGPVGFYGSALWRGIPIWCCPGQHQQARQN